ncbi:MAG: glycosyltransferase family 39 protein [Candidatus Daviesbacteria bacterium]|nr:glycosyltransferase family 39 protein [Candidatus Daviesbacteria bacterium]
MLLLILFLFGLIIRLLLIPLPGFKFDIDAWSAWAIRLSNFDFCHFYNKEFFSDYTPGYLYILSFLGFLKNLLILPDNIFYFLLKMPAIISELIIGLLIYKEIRKYISKKWVILAFVLILFNPALIFNSSIWGQIDSVLTLLLLITIILLKRNSFIFCSIFFGLALLVKPQAIALIPVFILFLIKNPKFSNLLKITIPGFLIIFILSFPFFPNQTLINLFQHVLNTANEYSSTSVNAYNLWGIVGFWISDSQLWNNLSYQAWGYILLAGYWIILGYLFLKNRLSLFAVAALATMGFFFLPTRVHERYLYPAIIFLILTAANLRSKLLLILTTVLSLLHFLNLYYVYIYYNEIYLQLPKVLYNQIIYNFLDSSGKNLSLISTMIFIFITIVIIKNNAKTSEN